MSPYVYTRGSIGITWFMLLSVISIIIGYIYIKFTAKNYDIDKSKIEDAFPLIVASGFIGARLVYVLLNLDVYRDNLFDVVSLSHMNLYLYGGILFGLLTIYIISKKEKISFIKFLDKYLVFLRKSKKTLDSKKYK